MASCPPPSFFIVLLHPSHSQLQLPPSFVSNHLGNQVPKDPIIQTSSGGYIWKLKIKKIDENYCFTNGWSNLVKEIQLGFGDLLLFRLIDKSTFKLLIYSPSGCQKNLPPKIKVEQDVDSVSSVDDGVCNVDDDVTDDDDDIDDDGDEEEEEDIEDEKEEADESDDDDDDDDVCDVDVDDDDDDEDVDDDGVHIDGHDGDPFFYSTISKAHKSTLRLPTEFVGLAEIDADKTVIVKNLDEQEWPIQLLSEKVNGSERYYLSAGWAEFRRSNDLLEGDECVFKFITSEDKLCLAKVTKKRRPTRQSQTSSEIQVTEHGGNVDVKVDGDDDNHGEDDDADHIDGEDDDPSFTATMSKSHKHILRLPAEFVEFSGIEAGKTIMMKDPENKEWPMGLRKQKKKKKKQPERFYICTGWSDFHRSNGLSEGDECVFKFNRSEGKLRLAKVTNIKWQSQQSSEKILATEDDEHDADDDDEHDDGDPFFTKVISKSPSMQLPEEFVRLPGIEDGKMITVKNLDGKELQVGLRLEKRNKRSYYLLSAGWRHFVESNKLMYGDECVFKFIRSEGKLCLAKVTNKKRPIRGDGVDVENEDNGSSGGDDNDVEDDDIDGEEDGGGEIDGDNGDPFVTFTVPRGHTWRFPEEFMGLPGIGRGKSIMVKNLDGNEQPWRLLLEKSYTKTERYIVSAGWTPFIRSNSLSAGDKCVLKFIRSEGKLCLTNVTKNKKSERKRQSAKVVTRMRRQPQSAVGKLCLTKFANNKREARKGQSAGGISVTEARGRKRGRNGADVAVAKRPRGRSAKR